MNRIRLRLPWGRPITPDGYGYYNRVWLLVQRLKLDLKEAKDLYGKVENGEWHETKFTLVDLEPYFDVEIADLIQKPKDGSSDE